MFKCAVVVMTSEGDHLFMVWGEPPLRRGGSIISVQHHQLTIPTARYLIKLNPLPRRETPVDPRSKNNIYSSTPGIMSLLRTTLRRPLPPLPMSSSLSLTRQYNPSLPRQAYKDDQDRTSLKPRPNDSTKSGSDDEAAECATAFDPTVTDPDLEFQSCWKGPYDNPLEASGANREISKETNERAEEKQAPRDGKTRESHSSKEGKKAGRMTSSFPK